MEKDAQLGEEHEKRLEKERLKKVMEKFRTSRQESEDADGFLFCQPTAVLSKDDKKKVVNSVQLTKALVLLGFSCWSELEPGKFKNNFKPWNLIFRVLVFHTTFV